ncbi:hypothetical protein DEO72_LG7g1347 [Vigna unguiculata]|uniref:Uncharacterized protein n=1 Tax=Vigna unguiculata TaxID=3917 RepID=A0A4D6MH51_VIGUN|nr:hypothetical protein DEO72_LG7g1347 [Vigna unguiculata]
MAAAAAPPHLAGHHCITITPLSATHQQPLHHRDHFHLVSRLHQRASNLHHAGNYLPAVLFARKCCSAPHTQIHGSREYTASATCAVPSRIQPPPSFSRPQRHHRDAISFFPRAFSHFTHSSPSSSSALRTTVARSAPRRATTRGEEKLHLREPCSAIIFLHQSASSSSSCTTITARHHSRTTASQTPFPQPPPQIERDERFHLAPPRTCTAEQRRRRRRRSLPPLPSRGREESVKVKP